MNLLTVQIQTSCLRKTSVLNVGSLHCVNCVHDSDTSCQKAKYLCLIIFIIVVNDVAEFTLNSSKSIKMQSANDENVDFSELCRICAKKVKNLVSLFHTKRKGKTMAEMLSICLQKSVHQNDGRPTEICLACIPKLLNSFELLITAKSSEHFFQQVILSKICNQKVQPNDQCDESKPIAEIPTVQCVEPLITSEFDEDVKDPLAGGSGEVKTEQLDTSLTTPAARIKTNIQIKPKQHGKMEISNSEEVIQLCSVKRTRFLQCYICKRTPFTLKRLRTHLKKHEDKKPFKCFVCGEVYRLKFDLDHHLCQGDQITCEYCPEVFHTLNGILTHLKMHNADLLVYKCTRCIKEFNLTNLLKYHDAFHDRYQFACKICGKKFATRQTTTNHTRLVHSSERRKIRFFFTFILNDFKYI